MIRKIGSFKADWFHKRYFPYLGARYFTMKAAVNLFLQRGGSTIVETGCQREWRDWGAGCSTQVLGSVATLCGGTLYSIDNDRKHLSAAQFLTRNNPKTQFIEGDSVDILHNFQAKTGKTQIDLLYLDSYDYPFFELLDRYGQRVEKVEGDLSTDPDQDNPLYDIDDVEIARANQDLIFPCQQHCLSEITAVWPLLHDQSIVLIDDNQFPGGGKSRLAKEYLTEKGWHLVLDYQQTLWIKE